MVLLKSAFCLILVFVCCPLFGQQGSAAASPKAAPLPRDTMLFRRWVDTVIWPAPLIKNLRPAGDIRLRRFGWTTLALEPVAAGDTFDLLLVSKSATPFKKIQWAGKTHENKVVFSHRDTMSQASSPKLKIKPRCFWKRQVATLTLRSIGQRHSVPVVDTQGIQIRTNQYKQRDTMVLFFRTPPGRQKATIDTSYSVATIDSNGTVRHRSKQLVLKTRTYKPDTLLPKGTFGIPRLGKKVIRYGAFQKGDTVFFDVQARGKKPLRTIALKNHKGQWVNGTTDAMAFADTLVMDDDTPYIDLYLRGTPAWKKQAVSVKVWRIRPTVVDSFYAVKDTFYRTSTHYVYDTLALTVKDDSLQLTPVRDIESDPTGRMEIQVPVTRPDGYDLRFVAYWIGIGQDCLLDYQTIEKTVPPDWGLPGAPLALGAYGMGHPLFLPHLNIGDVAMVFNESGRRIGPNETASLLGLSLVKNARVVRVENFEEQLRPDPKSNLYRFFACFNNKSTVNTYPVQVKMVAYYQKVKSAHREIKQVGTKTELIKLRAK